MRRSNSLVLALTLLIALSSMAVLPLGAQEIVWVTAPEPIPDIPAYLKAKALARGETLAEKAPESSVGLIDRSSDPSNRIFLPSYQVDTTSASGETTLFAIKHTGINTHSVTIIYFDRFLTVLRSDMRSLTPHEVITINVRDIPQVTAAAEVDGFARGFVRVEGSASFFTGDFFQVNPGQNFATGERMYEISDFCQFWGIRFLNGGAFTGGTDYRFLVNTPQGGDPNVDDPTLISGVYNESGTLLATRFGYTDAFVVEDTAANIVGNLANSGSLEIFIDDTGTTGGLVFGNFSATGRFSVGMNGVCIPPVF